MRKTVVVGGDLTNGVGEANASAYGAVEMSPVVLKSFALLTAELSAGDAVT